MLTCVPHLKALSCHRTAQCTAVLPVLSPRTSPASHVDPSQVLSDRTGCHPLLARNPSPALSDVTRSRHGTHLPALSGVIHARDACRPLGQISAPVCRAIQAGRAGCNLGGAAPLTGGRYRRHYRPGSAHYQPAKHGARATPSERSRPTSPPTRWPAAGRALYLGLTTATLTAKSGPQPHRRPLQMVPAHPSMHLHSRPATAIHWTEDIFTVVLAVSAGSHPGRHSLLYVTACAVSTGTGTAPPVPDISLQRAGRLSAGSRRQLVPLNLACLPARLRPIVPHSVNQSRISPPFAAGITSPRITLGSCE